MSILSMVPNAVVPQERKIINFGGYSNDPVIASGEMRNMLNLTSDQYPYLAQRPPRGIYADQKPVAVDDGETAPSVLPERNDISNIAVWKGGLVVVAGTDLYYKGLLIGTLNEPGDKILVGIKDLLCVYPDKVYFDASLTPAVLRSLEADTGVWSVSVRLWTNAIQITGMTLDSNLFKVGDAVDISLGNLPNGVNAALSAIVKGWSDTLLKLPENTLNEATTGYSDLVDWVDGSTGKEVTADYRVCRLCPSLEYVLEYQNRLWGVEGNTIYSCKLGDPTNWFYYTSGEMENAADSYAVAVGTDGNFTGIAAFPSHLVFFKEQYMHKLYGGNKPSSYQLVTMECNGMEEGSYKSAVTVDGVMYYKSPLGIMAYTGDYPVHITSSFRARYSNAVAGTDKSKYWISMQNDTTGAYEMFVYDFARKMWHKEDYTQALQFANLDGRLLYIDKTATTTAIRYISAKTADEVVEADRRIPWMAEFGEFDEMYEFDSANHAVKKKVYSKLHLRFTMSPGSEMSVWLSIDNQDWELVANVVSDTDRSVYLPVIPRRCDKFKLKLEGRGNTRVESLMRSIREGSAL